MSRTYTRYSPMLVALALGFWLPAVGHAQMPEAKPAGEKKPQPVPEMQITPQPNHEAAFERGGEELARLHFGPQLRRPFVFPIVGPAGRSLTRMGHPRDPEGHSHHNSVWISHHDVSGVDFWADRGENLGLIVHRKILKYDDTDREAFAESENLWVSADGRRELLIERRTVRVQSLAGKEWLLVLDLDFRPAKEEAVTFGKTPFGLVGVRMAKTIGVKDGGGTIRNSAGGVNEKEVFWKPAKWVDYSGPITRDASEGVTLFDHPANPNHPCVFHVRDDGWMGAALTFSEPRTLEPGAHLVLRYGLYVHAGIPEPAAIELQWKAFAATAPAYAATATK